MASLPLSAPGYDWNMYLPGNRLCSSRSTARRVADGRTGGSQILPPDVGAATGATTVHAACMDAHLRSTPSLSAGVNAAATYAPPPPWGRGQRTAAVCGGRNGGAPTGGRPASTAGHVVGAAPVRAPSSSWANGRDAPRTYAATRPRDHRRHRGRARARTRARQGAACSSSGRAAAPDATGRPPPAATTGGATRRRLYSRRRELPAADHPGRQRSSLLAHPPNPPLKYEPFSQEHEGQHAHLHLFFAPPARARAMTPAGVTRGTTQHVHLQGRGSSHRYRQPTPAAPELTNE